MYDVFDSRPTTLINDAHRHFRYIAHEHLEYATTLDRIVDAEGMSESRAKYIFSQMCYGLQHCHARKVAHG